MELWIGCQQTVFHDQMGHPVQIYLFEFKLCVSVFQDAQNFSNPAAQAAKENCHS